MGPKEFLSPKKIVGLKKPKKTYSPLKISQSNIYQKQLRQSMTTSDVATDLDTAGQTFAGKTSLNLKKKDAS